MKTFYCICCRTPLQNRQLDGAVHRVPPGFYDKGIFHILRICAKDIYYKTLKKLRIDKRPDSFFCELLHFKSKQYGKINNTTERSVQ